MPKPCLEWIDETGQVRRVGVTDKVFIGRSCAGIEKDKRIIVKDPTVSRDHAIFSLDRSQFQITDMSKNGVLVNGVRVTPGSTRHLNDGDIVTVGNQRIAVRYACATAMNGDTESTQAGPVEMIVTTLVADVRGFSGISQREDSTQIYAFMKDVFASLTAVVHDFKGTIKDYVGDAVYAFWSHGMALQHEQALLACNAALQQLRVIQDMASRADFDSQITGQDLAMGWGVTTGKVTIAHYSPRVADLALVGDTTNLAFRLSGMANKELKNAIVICSQTADLVRHVLSPVDLGHFSVRGRSGQEHIFGIGEDRKP